MALHFWAAPGPARKAGAKVPDRRKPQTGDLGGVIAALAVVGVIFLLRNSLFRPIGPETHWASATPGAPGRSKARC